MYQLTASGEVLLSSSLQEIIKKEMSNGGERFIESIHTDEKEKGKVTYDLSGNRLKVSIVYKHSDRQLGIAETMQHLLRILVQIYTEEDEFDENIVRIKDAGINSISLIP
ncbi:MAG: hypothetical protein ACP5OC_02640 [Thermoplasmata archaeon]